MRLLAFILLFAIPTLGVGQDFPAKSNRLVNDYTSTLSKSDKRKLEEKLVGNLVGKCWGKNAENNREMHDRGTTQEKYTFC